MFYDKFIELCNERGVKPSPLLTSLGLSKSNSVAWRDGKVPDIKSVTAIADYFGVTIDSLLNSENETKKSPAEDTAGDIKSILNKISNLSDADFQLLSDYIDFLISRENH